ncbi:MAG: hypothetical protein NVV63_02460 [Opitutus sp.]|nr:hypothetical protein [Opitutus sp.]
MNTQNLRLFGKEFIRMPVLVAVSVVLPSFDRIVALRRCNEYSNSQWGRRQELQATWWYRWVRRAAHRQAGINNIDVPRLEHLNAHAHERGTAYLFMIGHIVVWMAALRALGAFDMLLLEHAPMVKEQLDAVANVLLELIELPALWVVELGNRLPRW